jgi:photosystem II stability/assembly factor-like uncharacterized protein
MNVFRSVACAAVVSALVAFSEAAASQGFCLKNHYILDYPCGVQAGTAPPTFQIPPVPAGVDHWTATGPDGANVVTLVVDPVVPAIAFAGTTGSGVLKTTDGGASWATADAGLPTNNVLALAIDPANPSTLYAGTDAGVFKSTDGGQSWAAANGGLDGAPQVVVNALAIGSDSPATVYAGTSGGVFKTTNGAASWTSINAGLSGLAARVIAVDPTASSTVYIAVDDNVGYVNYGVFKSTDGGTSWAKIYSTPLGEDGGAPPITALAIDPHSPSRLYLAVAFNQVLTSPDGGSWSDLKVPAGDVWSLAVDPTSPATIYVGTYSGLIFRTIDGGAHWASASDGPQASSVNVIATAASAPATLYAGGHNGVFRSSDGAQTWAHLTLGIRNVGVYPLAVDPTDSSTIYTTADGVVTKTTDGGAHWVDSNSGLSGGWINRLAIDPVSPSTIYAGQTPPFGSSVIYKSTDGGAHWTTLLTIGPGPGLRTLTIASTQPSTLYIGVNSTGVLKSTDGGASWTAANNGLTAVGPYVSALAVDPTTADTVYAATDPTGQPDTPAKIFKSTDGAAHWREVPIGFPLNMEVTSLVIDPVTPSTIYAPYTDTGDQGGLLKSSDGGETWIDVSQNLPPGPVGKLLIGSGSPTNVYALTSAGIFASSDGATNWTPINNAGLPNVGVSDLAIDGTGSVLQAATIGGLFEYQLSGGSSSTGTGSPSITAPVIEYYNSAFDHFFITSNADEIAKLDSGTTAGWTRTGLQFNAYAASASGTAPVCRFFSTAFAPKSSHFYTPFASECAAVQASAGWSLESGAAFYIALPVAGGSCAAGLTPVYRLYNNGQGGAPNHRYTTNPAVRAQMKERGWVPEGLGANAVEMCAPQ